MKSAMLLIFATLMILLIPMIAFGDDHYGSESHDDENELAEETGELLGWVAIALATVPVALYPAKKVMPVVMRKRKELKKKSASFLGVLKKLHMPIGITIYFLVAWHGALLFWAEGEFGAVEWIGTVSLILATIGGMVGASFAKRRKVKPLRYIHMGLFTTAIVIAGIHVLLA